MEDWQPEKSRLPERVSFCGWSDLSQRKWREQVTGVGGGRQMVGVGWGGERSRAHGESGKSGDEGLEGKAAQRSVGVQTGRGAIWAEGAYLQNNPVTLLGSQVQRGLSHHLLPLPQRHVVKVPVVESVSELFS